MSSATATAVDAAASETTSPNWEQQALNLLSSLQKVMDAQEHEGSERHECFFEIIDLFAKHGAENSTNPLWPAFTAAILKSFNSLPIDERFNLAKKTFDRLKDNKMEFVSVLQHDIALSLLNVIRQTDNAYIQDNTYIDDAKTTWELLVNLAKQPGQATIDTAVKAVIDKRKKEPVVDAISGVIRQIKHAQSWIVQHDQKAAPEYVEQLRRYITAHVSAAAELTSGLKSLEWNEPERIDKVKRTLNTLWDYVGDVGDLPDNHPRKMLAPLKQRCMEIMAASVAAIRQNPVSARMTMDVSRDALLACFRLTEYKERPEWHELCNFFALNSDTNDISDRRKNLINLRKTIETDGNDNLVKNVEEGILRTLRSIQKATDRVSRILETVGCMNRPFQPGFEEGVRNLVQSSIKELSDEEALGLEETIKKAASGSDKPDNFTMIVGGEFLADTFNMRRGNVSAKNLGTQSDAFKTIAAKIASIGDYIELNPPAPGGMG